MLRVRIRVEMKIPSVDSFVMAREEESWKVLDLESASGDSEQAPPPPQPVKKSVFDRLSTTQGAGRVKKDRNLTDNSISDPEPGPKKSNITKPVGSTGSKPLKVSTSPKPASTGTSVFDRLASGDRLYRSSRRNGGDQKNTVKKPLVADPAQLPQQHTEPSPVSTSIKDLQNGENNGDLEKSSDQLDEDEEEMDDPIINISMIQPVKSVRHQDRTNNNKGTAVRLLSSHKKGRKGRKSWRITQLPLFLVERSSLARAALPVLPQFWAWICFLFNSLVPGTGTILSGLLGVCFGAPRFSVQVTGEHRFLALVINLTVGISQAVTVLFCLVGWCWSLGWGIILIKTAGHYKRWRKKNLGNPEDEITQHRHHMSIRGAPINMRDEEERY